MPELFLQSDKSAPVDNGTPTEEKPLVKREKVALEKLRRSFESLDAVETKSNFSVKAYGFDENHVEKTGQSLNKTENVCVKSLLELEDTELQNAILVEKEVMDETTGKAEKVKVAPDAVVLKGLDLSDESDRKAVLEQLAAVKEVFELKSDVKGEVTELGFKTRVLDLADVGSGFKDGEKVPVLVSAATGDKVDSKAYGTVVLSEKTNAVHEGFGTKERALDVFVAKEGTSVRVAKEGAIRSTVIYLKDVDDVTGVDVEGDGSEASSIDTFVDFIGVLPQQLEVMGETESEKCEKVYKPVARKTTVATIEGAKRRCQFKRL